ncbi:hypothetical protein TNCV_1916251 [Trichonephila clavipes]|uniref:Uncharacterized protein n=1 Tax=Trichonephila clavipes TaxID=2585209 RepID=A0A8X7BBG6_TRICX|nr:hypothetical protein TNCV_1916251 [Trichonephila clavipes]
MITSISCKCICNLVTVHPKMGSFPLEAYRFAKTKSRDSCKKAFGDGPAKQYCEKENKFQTSLVFYTDDLSGRPSHMDNSGKVELLYESMTPILPH